VFFDFEADPLWTADGVDWGLEYLFGVLDRTGTHRPLWAHDRARERQALADFLAMVGEHRRRYPKMHIYHYAPYEKTALLRLARRHRVGEDEIANLLRARILVDLYTVVRRSIRVGAECYGLKALEPLYLGHRQAAVSSATDSISEYARYCALRASGRAKEAAQVLNSIAEYNKLDCRSTCELGDWPLMRAFEHGITHHTGPIVPPIHQSADRGFVGRARVARRWSLRRRRQDCAATVINESHKPGLKTPGIEELDYAGQRLPKLSAVTVKDPSPLALKKARADRSMRHHPGLSPAARSASCSTKSSAAGPSIRNVM